MLGDKVVVVPYDKTINSEILSYRGVEYIFNNSVRKGITEKYKTPFSCKNGTLNKVEMEKVLGKFIASFPEEKFCRPVIKQNILNSLKTKEFKYHFVVSTYNIDDKKVSVFSRNDLQVGDLDLLNSLKEVLPGTHFIESEDSAIKIFTTNEGVWIGKKGETIKNIVSCFTDKVYLSVKKLKSEITNSLDATNVVFKSLPLKNGMYLNLTLA